jgi:hypothetical protein
MSIYNPPAIQPLGTVVTPEEGGTGLSETPAAGEILIGTTDGTFVLAKLEAGSGISILSASGEITISATGGGGGGGISEPIVVPDFNTNVAYADPTYFVPLFLTTEDGDVITAPL